MVKTFKSEDLSPPTVSRRPPLQQLGRRTPSPPSRRRPPPPVLSPPPPPLPPWIGPIPSHYNCNRVPVDTTDRGCRNHCIRQDYRTGFTTGRAQHNNTMGSTNRLSAAHLILLIFLIAFVPTSLAAAAAVPSIAEAPQWTIPPNYHCSIAPALTSEVGCRNSCKMADYVTGRIIYRTLPAQCCCYNSWETTSQAYGSVMGTAKPTVMRPSPHVKPSPNIASPPPSPSPPPPQPPPLPTPPPLPPPPHIRMHPPPPPPPPPSRKRQRPSAPWQGMIPPPPSRTVVQPWTIPPHYHCIPAPVGTSELGCRNRCVRAKFRTGRFVYFGDRLLCCCYNENIAEFFQTEKENESSFVGFLQIAAPSAPHPGCSNIQYSRCSAAASAGAASSCRAGDTSTAAMVRSPSAKFQLRLVLGWNRRPGLR
ncbi:hypothetical protein HPP92_005023 [Vanilla planifolia]|uniref:Uncharacterized protein n=1 Tax=Vanilla planifolia TaxID=51239 RepID=A0A835RLZ8_VANPL|nr:hypothetical protein HPP92_005023 [Vanilla planifolia]